MRDDQTARVAEETAEALGADPRELVFLADGAVWHTVETGKLMAGLAAAQQELPQVHKTKTARVPIKDRQTRQVKGHYEYTYADLSDVTSAVLPVFGKHGVAILQPPVTLTGGDLAIVTVAGAGGEVFGSLMTMGRADNPQDKGALISYGRRYALGGLTGVAPTEDDDANMITGLATPDTGRRNAPQGRREQAAQPRAGSTPRQGATRSQQARTTPSRPAQPVSLPGRQKRALTWEEADSLCGDAGVKLQTVNNWLGWVGLERSMQAPDMAFMRGMWTTVVQECAPFRAAIAKVEAGRGDDAPLQGLYHLQAALNESSPGNSTIERLGAQSGPELYKAVKDAVALLMDDLLGDGPTGSKGGA